jgi:hypothetical protein
MSDDRKALHELVDQAPEEALPRLLAWLTRLLYPSESSGASEMITFFPTEPGTADPEATSEAEREWRERFTAEADLDRTSEWVEQRVLRAVERLGLSRESLGRPLGQSASGTAESFLELQCDWQAGPRRHRLSTFYLEKQEIITFERAQVSEAGSELLYQVRVLTPKGEAEGELKVPFPSSAS